MAAHFDAEYKSNELVVSWFTRKSTSGCYQTPQHLINLLGSFSLGVDAWDSTTTHPSIHIEGSLIKTGNIGLRHRMAFGSECIEAPLVKKWVLSIPSKSHISFPVWSIIGIIGSEKASVNMKGIFYNQRNNGYGIKGMDGKLFHGGPRPVKGLRKPQFEDFMQICEGDKVQMELDLLKGKLSYKINGIDYGDAFAVDINVSYRLCVALFKNSQIILHK